MNPIKHFTLIDFKYNISEIISKHFKKEEKLNRDVVNKYLTYGPKQVNKFNHDYNGVIYNYYEINHIQIICRILRLGYFHLLDNILCSSFSSFPS